MNKFLLSPCSMKYKPHTQTKYKTLFHHLEIDIITYGSHSVDCLQQTQEPKILRRSFSGFPLPLSKKPPKVTTAKHFWIFLKTSSSYLLVFLQHNNSPNTLFLDPPLAKYQCISSHQSTLPPITYLTPVNTYPSPVHPQDLSTAPPLSAYSPLSCLNILIQKFSITSAFSSGTHTPFTNLILDLRFSPPKKKKRKEKKRKNVNAVISQ